MTDERYPDNVIHSDPEAFEDPLSNYEPPDYADELERELCEGEIGKMIPLTTFTSVTPDETVENAVKLMTIDNRFSLMVIENGELLGVVSERDVLHQVAENFDEDKTKTIREVMTPEPAVVYANDSPAKVMNLMATGGFRRLPVLDENDHVIGVIGPKRTTAFLFDRI